MWQTVVVLLILAVVLIYVIRHYAGVFRGEISACSTCSDDCCASRGKTEGATDGGKIPMAPTPCGCPPGPHSGTGGPAN